MMGSHCEYFFFYHFDFIGVSLFFYVERRLGSSATVQKVAVKLEFEAWLSHAATGKLSLSTQQ